MFRGTGEDMKNAFKLGIASVFLASNAHAVDFTVSLTDAENSRFQSAKVLAETDANITLTDEQFIRDIIRQYTTNKLVYSTRATENQSAQSAVATFQQSLDNDFPDETLDCSVQNAGFCFRGSCDAGSICEDVNGSCQCVSTPTTTVPAP